jgi:hypothetical protein
VVGQRSPGPTNWAWQMRQRPWGWPRNRLGRPLPMAAEEGEQDRGGAWRRVPAHADHPGPFVGRHAHHGHMVQRRAGPGDPLAVGRPAATTGHLGETNRQAQRHPSRARASTSFPIMVSDTCQAPQAASARSSSSTVTPIGSVPASRGWVAVSGTRAGSVPSRAPRVNVSVTRRPWSTTRARTPHGRSGPTRVRPSPLSRMARELVNCRVWIMRPLVLPGRRCRRSGAGPPAPGPRSGVSSRPGWRTRAPGSG